MIHHKLLRSVYHPEIWVIHTAVGYNIQYSEYSVICIVVLGCIWRLLISPPPLISLILMEYLDLANIQNVVTVSCLLYLTLLHNISVFPSLFSSQFYHSLISSLSYIFSDPSSPFTIFWSKLHDNCDPFPEGVTFSNVVPLIFLILAPFLIILTCYF